MDETTSEDGRCLSEQLSQVRLAVDAAAPLAAHRDDLTISSWRHGVALDVLAMEAGPDPIGGCLADDRDQAMDPGDDGDMGLDYICSQDYLCTPDFITPTEQQFSIDFEGTKENRLLPRSPVSLTIVRSKRRRPDVGMLTLESRKEISHLPLEEVSLSSDPVENLPSSTRDFRSTGVSINPNSGVRLSAIRKRVQTPPCIQNPFATAERELGCASERRSKWQGHQSVGGGGSSRYRDEFEEIKEIGRGCFSRVYRALNRIDGCLYAVKRTHHQLHQDTQRKQALVEVQALATLGAHPHVVRYHSAWFENDYLYIQTELCSCNLNEMKTAGDLSTEKSLVNVLWQMTQALALMSTKGLAHLDVKPENIYVLDGMYKLGDFGRASRLDGTMDIEEGDSRYTPLELLNDDHSQLHKADIFALGATMYELARGLPLPSSGSQFQALRQGKMALLPGFSIPFQNLLKEMMNPVANVRPAAVDILKHSIFDSCRRT